MNKLVPTVLILGLLLGVSAILAPPIMASPTIKRPVDLYDITVQGNSPQTIDYSWAYDTQSAEIIQNTMDTLLMWNTESSTAPYIYALATSESDGPVQIVTSDPIAGLNFENGAQNMSTAQYYWQYDFKLRQGVEFQPPYNYSLTTADVAYSFQRTIFQDRVGGPQWILDEPLLAQAAGLNVTTGGLADFTNTTQLAEVGALVRDAVQYNATDVWFNFMFPGAYAPFLQILCQTWSSIESKQWINNQVITGAGRPDWNGDFTNLTSWVPFWNPANSPLDKPTPMEYGSGPFILTPGTPDYTNNYWSATRNPNWWGGWPCFYPTEAGAGVAGYVNTIEVSWNYAWTAAKGYFLDGDCDFIELPSLAQMPELYSGPPPPFPNWGYYPFPSTASVFLFPFGGIRCYAPLNPLEVDELFFTFNITQSPYSGTIYPPVNGTGAYPSGDSGGIPSNFFGDVTHFNNPYGVDMRKAFAYSIDYAKELQVAALGEGSTPATAILPGLYGYNASITGYNYNLTMATQYFNMWPGLNTTGFTITFEYNAGNGETFELYHLIQTALQSINPLYHVNILTIDWGPYLTASTYQELDAWVMGWQVDYPDANDFAMPFYHSGGYWGDSSWGIYASWQLYSNATMDALIDEAIALPNGPQRLQLYSQIQQLAIDDCPSVPILQSAWAGNRHFEYDWVQGWYYNPIYPGHNFFNEYKFYYPPESNQATQAQPYSEYLPADVNRDGTVNMKDIAAVARSFGATYTEPVPSNWVFMEDLTNIRTINMKDITYVARQFGEVSPIGTWGPLVTITPVTSMISIGGSITFKATIDPFHGNATGRVIQWWYGTLASGQLGAPRLGGTGTTWTWTSIPAGASYVYCTVTDVFNGNTARANAGLPMTVTVESMHAGIYAS